MGDCSPFCTTIPWVDGIWALGILQDGQLCCEGQIGMQLWGLRFSSDGHVT